MHVLSYIAKDLGSIRINERMGRYWITVATTSGKTTLVFSRKSEAAHFLEDIDEVTSLMQGELG